MTAHMWLLWVDVPLAVLAALLWWSVSHMPPVPPLVDIQNSYRSYSTNKVPNYWPEHFLVSQPSTMWASAVAVTSYPVFRSTSGIPVSTVYLGPDGQQQF